MEFLRRLPDRVNKYLATKHDLRRLSDKFDDRVFAELAWRYASFRPYVTGEVLGPQETVNFYSENIYIGARLKNSIDSGFSFLQDCPTPHGIEIETDESGLAKITRAFYYSRDEIEVANLNHVVRTLLRGKATRPDLFVEYCPLVVVAFPFTHGEIIHPRQVSLDRLPITPDKFYEFSEFLWNRELAIAAQREEMIAK